jgi:hypothetical protein
MRFRKKLGGIILIGVVALGVEVFSGKGESGKIYEKNIIRHTLNLIIMIVLSSLIK